MRQTYAIFCIPNNEIVPIMLWEFVGTGPAEPITDRSGKSNRNTTSTLLLFGGMRILIDAGKEISVWPAPDYILITHSHTDAIGGLRNYLSSTVLAPREVFESRDAPAHFCVISERMELGILAITPVRVDHGDVPTFGYHFEFGHDSTMYASDMTSIPKESLRFFQEATVIITDGSGWDKPVFDHQAILQFLELAKEWSADRIIFTHIGRNVPDHEVAQREIRSIDSRAWIAWDGATFMMD
jgi:phosphoribosyl 1,2-cyclic phosphodiesterase